MARLVQLVHRFIQPPTWSAAVGRHRPVRALVIGDVPVDRHLEDSASSPRAEGPVLGGAAASAANLRSLGADVCFLGLVRSAGPAAHLRTVLHRLGIDDGWLVAAPGVSAVEVRHKVAHFGVRDDHSRWTAQARLLAHLETLYPSCDLVLLSDFREEMLGDAPLNRLRELRRERPVPLVVEARDLRPCRGVQASLVIAGGLDALLSVAPTAGFDRRPHSEDGERIGRTLLDILESEGVAIDLGGRGVLLVEREGGAVHAPVRVPRPQDVRAGSCLAAAVALALAVGASIEEGIRIGIAAGEIAASRESTATVAHQELLRRVSLLEAQEPCGV